MDASQKCLDLIKEFEGIFLKAYLDPVGIPTIGYGTVRYPNGALVRMGDTISLAEAEAFMRFECEEVSQKMEDITRGIALNQNQWDALVSFCYNLGTGALAESTLLRKLKAGDVTGAAAEFPRWNKATENGVKKELPGLTRRRAAEQALFQSKAAPAKPLEPSVSDEETVVSAKGYRDGDLDVVAGFSAKDKALTILELEDARPETLIAALRTFPKLAAFTFAPSGETVPDGPRARFSGLARPLPKTRGAPRLRRDLLMFGSTDSEDQEGSDVRNLQDRLAELGYYKGPIDGIFGVLTDAAAREFQEEFFGRAEADGLVGPITWKKLWGEAKPASPEVDPGTASSKTYLRLTRTEARDAFGCVVLILAYYKDGVLKGTLEVCSGQARKQIFRPGKQSPTGSMEPLPEGKWRIGDIEWAAGKDNFSGAIWNNGLGPAKIRLDYESPGTTPRSAIEIHIDWNRPTAPGTAGCIGLQNISDFRTLVGWLRETDPRDLFVDWSLGTCPQP